MDSKSHQRYKKGKKSRYGTDVATLSNTTYVAHQQRTDYAKTLIDPFLHIPARIPDLACYPTATYRTELHQVETVDLSATNQNTKMYVVDLHGEPRLWYYQGNGGTSPGAVRAVGSYKAIGPTNLATRFKATRLVSAMVKVAFAGNDNNTEGAIYGAFFPTDWKLQPGLPYTGVAPTASASNPNICWEGTKWSDVPEYYAGPLKNGVVLRYKPQDTDAFNMRSINTKDPFTGNNVSNDEPVAGSPFGTFIVLIDPTVACKMQFDIVLNWEGIVLSNDAGYPVGISGADPGALAHGINAAGASATAFSATSASWAKHVDGVLRSVA